MKKKKSDGNITCPKCGGEGNRGVFDGTPMTCVICHGSGTVSPKTAQRYETRQQEKEERKQKRRD